MSDVRVVIVEDHRLVADGLAAVLGAEADITVVGVATDVTEALAVIERSAPDIVICDIQLGDESGFAVLHAVPEDGPAFVMYSSHDHPSYARAALEGGALGFVLKGAPASELVTAVRGAATGRTSYAAQALMGARSSLIPTGRQVAIIERIAAGQSNDEISVALGVASKTIESHLRTLFDRYGVATRTELVLQAIAEGWIRTRDTSGGGGRFSHRSGAWFADPALAIERDAGPCRHRRERRT